MRFNKSLCILPLIGCLFLSSTVFALQSGNFTYTVSNGEVTITGYTGSGGAVTIPPTIDGMPVVGIGYDAFEAYTNMTSITIPSSVTTIGDWAFYNCTGLTSVTIGSGVTTIGNSAFVGCTGLTSISIPASVTSIGEYAFGYCTGLTSIVVAAGNTSYASQDGILYNYGMTTLIQCPEGKTGEFSIPSSVITILHDAFLLCTGLTSITIQAGVTTIGQSAFDTCTGLTSITIPASITSIGEEAFYGCTKLVSAYFYGNAPTMGSSVFDGCASGFTVYYLAGATGFSNLWHTYPTAVFTRQYADFTYTISNGAVKITGYTGAGGAIAIPSAIEGLPVVSIGNQAFFNQASITGITIPDSVTSIGSRAFSGCTGLTSMTIPSSVTSIGDGVFLLCSSMTSIEVAADNPNFSSLNGVLYNKGKTALLQCPCGKTGNFTIPAGVTAIGVYAFSGCTGLTGIALPASVTIIRSYAFSGCTGLTSITIPKNVTSIKSYTFDGCTGLTAAYFYGNAPTLGSSVFDACASGFTVYYTAGATGFTNPWYTYPTAVFTPLLTTTTSIRTNSTTTTFAGSATSTTTTASGSTTTTACPATQVLGADNPRLENLRDFRDSKLARSATGCRIINIYYKNADSINAALNRSPALRLAAKRVLETIAPVLEKK